MAKNKPTINDVAKYASVSTATVSHVMSGKKSGTVRVGEATRKRVLVVAKELGYQPNTAARNLRRKRTDRICIVVASPTAPINQMMFQAIQAHADAGRYLIVIYVAGTAERELQIYQELCQGFADGALFFNTRFLNESHFTQLADLGVAVVVNNCEFSAEGFDIVRTDANTIQDEMIAHLVAQGHQRIGLLADSSILLHVERMQEYLNNFDNYGVTVDHRYICSQVTDRREAYDAVGQLMALSEPPSVILTTADRLAIGALQSARDMDIRIPEDLAIVGFGNVAEGEITSPALTTLGQPSFDFSDFSHLLFSRLSSSDGLEGRVIEVEYGIIWRGSV